MAEKDPNIFKAPILQSRRPLALFSIVGITAFLAACAPPPDLNQTKIVPGWLKPNNTLSLQKCNDAGKPAGRTLPKDQPPLRAEMSAVPRGPIELGSIRSLNGGLLVDGTTLVVGGRSENAPRQRVTIGGHPVAFQYGSPLARALVDRHPSAGALLEITDVTFTRGLGTTEKPSPILVVRYSVGASGKNIQIASGKLNIEDIELCFPPARGLGTTELAKNRAVGDLLLARQEATKAAEKTRATIRPSPVVASVTKTREPTPTTTRTRIASPTRPLPTGSPSILENAVGDTQKRASSLIETARTAMNSVYSNFTGEIRGAIGMVVAGALYFFARRAKTLGT